MSEAVPYELVVFDCDGVLVDTERLAVQIDVEVLGKMGWALSEEEVIARFVGRSKAYMTEQLSLHLGRELPGDWSEPFRDLYISAYEANLTAVPGVVAVLDDLDAAGTTTCVASSSSHRHLRHVLELTGLYERFEGRIFSAADVARGKPAPDVFLHTADCLGVAPARCAAVEDSAPGVEAALAAGMDAYAYCGGVTSAETLGALGVPCFNDMGQLAGRLRATA